jgi:glycosyltransferase involved in cell wall biosynthesis
MHEIELIVPCLNEASSAPGLIREIESTLTDRRTLHLDNETRFSIIIVDDGSQDDTKDVFCKLLACSGFFCRRTVLSLSRNFGKEAALIAGLGHCRGDACIILDADLQDPPALIHDMLAAWLDGYKVVNAVRRERTSDGFLKRITAAGFYFVFARFSHLDVKLNASDFRLLDRKAIKVILDFPERVRFSKGFFAWIGFKQKDIYFTRPERKTGETKWGSWKLWNYALDGIFSFSTAPVRIWSYIGLAVTSASFLAGLTAFIRTVLFGIDVPGYASLFTAVTFLGGLQLIGIGVLGEYIGRVYIEAKQRPHYVIESIVEI